MASIVRSIPILALIGLLALPRSGVAMDVTVTRFDDPAPTGCTAADCSLREAVIITNAFAGADRIVLPAGTYTLSIPGANEDASQTGDLDITDDLFILGAGSATTTIQWSLRFERIFQIFDVAPTAPERAVTLSGITIKGGGAPTGGTAAQLNGGGISARGNNLFVKLVDVTLQDNFAMGGIGGGAYLSVTHLQIGASHFMGNISPRAGGAFIGVDGGPLKITGTTASANSAGRCAGMEILAAVDPSGPPIDLSNLIIEDNLADADGGGLCIGAFNSGTTLHNVSILNNVAGRGGAGSGGGMLLEWSTPDASLFGTSVVLDSSYVVGNVAHGFGGGILFGDDVLNLNGPCDFTLINTQVSGNSTIDETGPGGGMAAMPAGTNCRTTIAAGSSVDHNNAHGSGGGVYFNDTGTFDVIDSTIASNTSSNLGGGLYVSGGPTTIRRSTIVANAAPTYGGGIEVYGPVTVDSSTFDANTATNGASIDNNNKSVTVDWSTIAQAPGATSNGTVYYGADLFDIAPIFAHSILVGTCGNSAPFATSHDIESPGSTCHLTGTSFSNVSASALDLALLADNGGPTQTRKPLVGSVAISAVPASDCTNFDQRNYVRTGTCDIGAIESNGLADVLFRNGFQLF